MQQQRYEDPLSPEKLQLFAATLSGLAPEEVRKAKVLYIRNAITDYHALKDSFAAFGQMQGCMSLVPFFWPVLGAQKKMMSAGTQRARERILNAIDVWRDDLRGETFRIDGEEFTV